MRVEKWMTPNVVTVEKTDSLSTAAHRMKENGIRRLPVLASGKLIGMITDRDVRSASPSKATSLDIWELHFLLEKLKVADVMTEGPITITGDTTIEKAAMVMMEKRIGGLPVLDAKGGLMGILTEDDVFRALVDVTGVQLRKTRVSLLVPDEPGSIREVADVCRARGGKILSILVSYAKVPAGTREVILRIDVPDTDGLRAELAERFQSVEVTQD